jgi:hypothetical protein
LNSGGAAKYLSRCLGKPVFSLHIHGSDLWMYSLYDNGDIVVGSLSSRTIGKTSKPTGGFFGRTMLSKSPGESLS